jgi:hypothetical protein
MTNERLERNQNYTERATLSVLCFSQYFLVCCLKKEEESKYKIKKIFIVFAVLEFELGAFTLSHSTSLFF